MAENAYTSYIRKAAKKTESQYIGSTGQNIIRSLASNLPSLPGTERTRAPQFEYYTDKATGKVKKKSGDSEADFTYDDFNQMDQSQQKEVGKALGYDDGFGNIDLDRLAKKLRGK